MNCTIKTCNNNRITGDRIFCNIHRDLWIEYCKVANIHEEDVSPLLVQEYLKDFKEQQEIIMESD